MSSAVPADRLEPGPSVRDVILTTTQSIRIITETRRSIRQYMALYWMLRSKSINKCHRTREWSSSAPSYAHPDENSYGCRKRALFTFFASSAFFIAKPRIEATSTVVLHLISTSCIDEPLALVYVWRLVYIAGLFVSAVWSGAATISFSPFRWGGVGLFELILSSVESTFSEPSRAVGTDRFPLNIHSITRLF